MTSEFDNQPLHDLYTAESELNAPIAVSEARFERLMETIFRDGPTAGAVFKKLTRERGMDDALAIVEGRGSLPRIMWFGRLRGGIFNPGDRSNAKAAITQLPDAAREMELLHKRRADVRKARANLLRASDDRRIQELQEDRTRERERAITRERGRRK